MRRGRREELLALATGRQVGIGIYLLVYNHSLALFINLIFLSAKHPLASVLAVFLLSALLESILENR